LRHQLLYSLEHFHVQFSRFPRHQGVTHCMGRRNQRRGYGADLRGLAMSTIAIWCRVVRFRDFSAPPPDLWPPNIPDLNAADYGSTQLGDWRRIESRHPWRQRLEALPHWHIGKRIEKIHRESNLSSIEKYVNYTGLAAILHVTLSLSL